MLIQQNLFKLLSTLVQNTGGVNWKKKMKYNIKVDYVAEGFNVRMACLPTKNKGFHFSEASGMRQSDNISLSAIQKSYSKNLENYLFVLHYSYKVSPQIQCVKCLRDIEKELKGENMFQSCNFYYRHCLKHCFSLLLYSISFSLESHCPFAFQ